MGAAQPLSPVDSPDPQPFPEGFFATTNQSGEALIQGEIAGKTCKVFLFFSSRLQKKACAKSSFSGGNASCIEEGSAVFSQCSNMLVMTPGGQAQLSGTWVNALYLPKEQATLYIVAEGEVTVWPVTDNSYGLGEPKTVTPGNFYYTVPPGVTTAVPGLTPGQVYPWSRLPAITQFYGIQPWMSSALQTATQAGLRFPSANQLAGPPELTVSLQPADLRPEDRQLIPASSVAASLYIPVDIVLTNLGGQPAAPFKVSVDASSSDGNFARPFISAGQDQAFYAYTKDPLLPGDQVTLHGIVLFPADIAGQTASITATVDSCAGEELTPAYCRVTESDETNNVSTPLRVRLQNP